MAVGTNWKRNSKGNYMKIAILADIHGNLEALKAVVADMAKYRLDCMVSLGDNVGYGPDPDGVVDLMREIGIESIIGNHEFALCDKRAQNWLNFQAAENNEQTKGLLSPRNLEYSCSLPFFLERAGGYFVHGFPKDSVFRYLTKQNDERIMQLFQDYAAAIFFVGHTHKLQLLYEEDGSIVRNALPEGVHRLDQQKKYIVNSGSVGQPRDGNQCAKYIIWDSLKSEIEVRFVPYDRQKTVELIERRGFPKAYGLRL